MTLVLNEYQWAEEMLRKKNLGPKPVETLTRIAKYYIAHKYTKKEIRKELDNFLLACKPNISLAQWSETLDKITKQADKYPLITIDRINITEPEMKKIATLKGKPIRRLAFTLLCVAKYWDTISENNHHWVNTSDKEIMRMSNINMSLKRQSLLFAELRQAGFIDFTKKIDNLNVQVNFMADGKTAMQITDFRNLGFQYLNYYDKNCFQCENCKITVKQQTSAKGRPKKYCKDCALEIKTRQNINAVMRHRKAI